MLKKVLFNAGQNTGHTILSHHSIVELVQRMYKVGEIKSISQSYCRKTTGFYLCYHMQELQTFKKKWCSV